MVKDTIDSLVRQRDAIMAKLGFIGQEVKKNPTSPLDLPALEIYMKEVDLWKDKLDDNFMDITDVAPSDLLQHQNTYYDLLTSIRILQHGLRALIVAISPTTTQTPTSAVYQQNAKLPKLEIKPFHGGFLDWMTFKDTFEASVHNNSKLPKIEKFAYLKSFIGGEASQIIGDYASTDANYDLAWAQLNERYQNQNKIYTANMDRFCKHPRTSATAKSINSLVDSANRCLRSMELLGFATCRQVEAMMVYHMVDKLDDKAKDLWEHAQDTDDIPEYKDLCRFLLRHATAIEDRQRSSDKSVNYDKSPKDKIQKAIVYHAQAKPDKCKLGCNHSHPLYRCKKLLRATVDQRWAMIKELRLCFKCFQEGHSVQNCDRGLNCKVCNKPHNTLLHSVQQPRQPGQERRGAPPVNRHVFHADMHRERDINALYRQAQQAPLVNAREEAPNQQQAPRVYHTNREPGRSD